MPLALHDYFGNYTRLRTDFEDFLAGYGDLVRHVLLYNYGGLWMDTDVVLLRDIYPVTVQVRLSTNDGVSVAMLIVKLHLA